MNFRDIKTIVKARKVNMGGFIVDQPLPVDALDMIDPFLLIHHAEARYEPESNVKEVGVGPHPHRGFSPVTMVFQGEVHHRDSRGNSSIVKAGGTQWMNSGMGVIHSERPSKELAERGGIMEIIQFWVNSPGAFKMRPPEYIPLTADETPVLMLGDGESKIAVVSGQFENLQGPLKGYSPLLVLRLDLKKGVGKAIHIPSDFNALIYLLDGNLRINHNSDLFKKQLGLLDSAGEGIYIEAVDSTRAIILAGKPLNEPVFSHGPFVMNNESQIMQAMRDYQMGKMGFLVEEFD